jgi:hypothetical protein
MATVDIKAIDDAIRKLEQLKKLASDPALAPFIHVNGNGAMAATDSVAAVQGDGSEITLKSTVLAAGRELREFDVKDILKILTDRQFKFEGGSPQKSIGNVLHLLRKRGVIRLLNAGSGRKPARYAVV